MKKYNFVYKTTNLINGNIYIGVHTTDNLDDGYLGSGNAISRAIAKYGKISFKREILSYHYTVKSALAEEAKLVNSDFIRRKDNYNIVVGGGFLGSGPDHPSYGKPCPNDRNGESNPNYGNRGEKSALFGREYSAQHREAISKGNKGKKRSHKHVEALKKGRRSSLHKIKKHGDRAIELYQLGYGARTISEMMAAEGMLSQNRKIPAAYSMTAIRSFLNSSIRMRDNKGVLSDPDFVSLLKKLHQEGVKGADVGKRLAAEGYTNKSGDPYPQKTTWRFFNELGLSMSKERLVENPDFINSFLEIASKSENRSFTVNELFKLGYSNNGNPYSTGNVGHWNKALL